MTSRKKHSWKVTVEKGFSHLGVLIGTHPKIWLCGCLIIIAAIASQLQHIRQDTSIEGFLEKGSEELLRYDEFKDIFGRDEVFLINIEVDDIYDPAFIENLRRLHMQLEDEVPHVKTVDSLINARHTYGKDDTLYIEDLLPVDLPDDPQELEELKQYTFNNDNYLDFLISRDHHLIAIMVRLEPYNYHTDQNGRLHTEYLSDKDLRDALYAIEDIVDQYRGVLSDDIRLAGSMPISIMLGRVMERDFAVFSGLANLLIGIVLMIIFRRASGVLMPLTIMALSVVVTISFMAIFDTPLQVSTSILPSFLLAVCVGDSIHLLTIFYRHYDAGETKIQALANALEHTGLAIFFTSITTAAGLASFSTSELSPVAALGIYGALGSMVAFLLTVFILPCLIALFPLKRRPLHSADNTPLNRFLLKAVHLSTTYPKTIVACGMTVFFISLIFASQSTFSHHPIDWLPDDEPALLALKKHEQRMGSSMTIEVVLDTGKDRGVIDHEFMQTLDDVQKELESWETDTYRVVKAICIADIVKETNRALHDNDQNFYSVPDDSALISQELFMVELDEPDDLYNLIDKEYRQARLTLMVPWVDALYGRDLLNRLEQLLNERLGPHTERITITGVTALLGATFAEMLVSTAESYGIAAVAITIMMVLLIGNLKLGLLSMIPSLLPILIVLSIIHLLGIPLDMLTMLIGSIAIGLTVDDNVHFMHGFRRIYIKTGDPAYAIEKTILSTGRAMLITSIVLSIGFIIYTQAQMKNMIGFGIMTALCIMLALIASFLLGPALMMLANKTWHHQSSEPKAASSKRMAHGNQ